MRLIVAILIAASVSGCGQDKASPAGQNPPGESAMSTAIDGVTGRSAVRAGQRAKKAVEAASSTERKNLGEALGE